MNTEERNKRISTIKEQVNDFLKRMEMNKEVFNSLTDDLLDYDINNYIDGKYLTEGKPEFSVNVLYHHTDNDLFFITFSTKPVSNKN